VTPAELRVIEAAKTWHDVSLVTYEAGEAARALWNAVQALEAEREAGEMTIDWFQVVESDQIWSEKTKKWYQVISSVALDNDRMRIQAKGLPKSITPLASADVRVRRGATGQTMDMWNVVWSAQTIPSTPELESEVES
jgi:hypothetical protein